MNVWFVEAPGAYAHGTAVIAADTEEQAAETARTIKPCGVWHIEWWKLKSVERIKYVSYAGILPAVLAVNEFGE